MPLAHSGWSAWISVDGEELPQFSVKVEERPGLPPDIPKFYTVSAWIPSQVEKEFSIHIEYDDKIKRTSDCAAKMDLDGRRIRRGTFIKKCRKVRTINGEMVTERIQRPFVFAALQLTDEEPVGNYDNLYQIGTIKIQLIRTTLTSDRVEFRNDPFCGGPLSIKETAKKTISHCVSLGPAKPRLNKPVHSVHTRDIDKDFFLTFVFHYASADILRAREIIPTVATILPGSDADLIGGSSNPIEIDDASEDEDEEINAIEEHIQKQMEEVQKQKQRLDALKRKKNGSGGAGLVKKPKIEEDVKPKIKKDVKSSTIKPEIS